jgi:hypothetical protein
LPEVFACQTCECGGQCDKCRPFPHPETGVLLDTKDEFIEAMNEIDLRMSPMYVVRRQIREEFARRFDPYLPGRRSRSDKQARVAQCPRCGGGLE